MEMLPNTNIIVHPQAERLRDQNRQMQAEIARLIVERDYLKNVICPHICAEYRNKIGALELRVFQFECDIRAFIRRIEMANARLNRGEKFFYAQIEREIETEFAAWGEQIAERMRSIKAARNFENLPTLTCAESKELQNLYRKLAFLLHPDIIGNTDERRAKLWLQTAEAYENGDLPTLRTIRLIVGNEITENDSTAENANILENLKARNAELKLICEKILDEIGAIKNSAPYIWHEMLDDDDELEKYRNNLRGKIETLCGKRRQAVENWTEILRFAEDARLVQIPDEPTEIFTADEDDWAEIIYENGIF